MPRFKTTEMILKGIEEYFDENWMDTPFLQLPKYDNWDYSRELQIEDVDIWEVISEASGPTGLYASWLPYAEFYMIIINRQIDSTYYGKGADEPASKRCDELGIYYPKKMI
jgi:hypothetical protein